MSGLRCKVWVIDDDRTYLDLVSNYLVTLGYTVRCFSAAEECLEYLHEKPTVIVIDCNLRGDLKVADFLRMVMDILPAISVIYLSAAEKAMLSLEAFPNGAADFIRKDSASLIRLKMKLEEIHSQQVFTARQRSKQIVAVAISAVIFMTALSLLYYFLGW